MPHWCGSGKVQGGVCVTPEVWKKLRDHRCVMSWPYMSVIIDLSVEAYDHISNWLRQEWGPPQGGAPSGVYSSVLRYHQDTWYYVAICKLSATKPHAQVGITCDTHIFP
jgi:hypothetical protein